MNSILVKTGLYLGGLFGFRPSYMDRFPEDLRRASKNLQKAAEAVFDGSDTLKALSDGGQEPSNVDVQKAFASINEEAVRAALTGTDLEKRERAMLNLPADRLWWKIETVNDDRLCPRCAAWTNRYVSNGDPTLPDVEVWEESGALHPNCRCQLVLVDPSEIWSNLHGDELMSWARKNRA